jgi:hypothetical protein
VVPFTLGTNEVTSGLIGVLAVFGLACTVQALLVVLCYSACRRRPSSRKGHSDENAVNRVPATRLSTALGDGRCPSIVISAWVASLQGVLLEAFRQFKSPSGNVPLGIAAIVAFTVVPVVAIERRKRSADMLRSGVSTDAAQASNGARTIHTPSSVPAQAQSALDATPGTPPVYFTRYHTATFERRLPPLLHPMAPQGYYKPSGLCHQWGAAFGALLPGRWHFFYVAPVRALLSAVIVSVRVNTSVGPDGATSVGCRIQHALLLALAAIAGVVALVCAPYRVRLHVPVAGTTSLALCLVMVSPLISPMERHGGNFVLGTSIIGVAGSLCLLCMTAFEGLRMKPAQRRLEIEADANATVLASTAKSVARESEQPLLVAPSLAAGADRQDSRAGGPAKTSIPLTGSGTPP